RAQAVAVRGGRIEAVGTDEELRPFIGANTEVVELSGRAVTPGLVDGHCHLYGLGRSMEMLSLKGLGQVGEVAARVRDSAGNRPQGEWIIGRGWDQNLWTPAEFPTHEPLTAAAPEHPVSLRRVDGHALWVNRAAMAIAGVTSATADPKGGRILRDAQGNPTGVFIDNAIDLIEGKIPRPTPVAIERQVLMAADVAVAAGLTGVHEMGIDDDVAAVYRSLAGQERLKLRVYGLLAGEDQINSLSTRELLVDPDGTAMFVLRAAKLFADGALGSRGAALFEPYSDDPSNRGLILLGEEELRQAALTAAMNGWQLAVHAIGDRANRTVLDAIEAARSATGNQDLRFRVEHAQVVAPQDIERFARAGAIASMQPTHATSDMPWAEKRLGPTRIKGAYAWRSIMSAGARLVGGSDFPVEEVSPLLGIFAAVSRQDTEGNPPGGFLPEQRLTLEEAIRIFTVDAAWASFAERTRGLIAPGYVADLTIFDRELMPDRSLLDTHVERTIVGGKTVFRRAGNRSQLGR
ncbi:MAG: amidohydrolase, partial [Deltaproteobacteria bacterium]|nr:amidohydrolase [Deltaproteobacteria bacterium]